MKKILFFILFLCIKQVNAQSCFGNFTGFPVDSFPVAVKSADLNGDGFADLAVVNNYSNNVSILLGNGAGSFGAATNFPVGINPFAITIADFNGDAKADLAVANIYPNNISILLGTGTGNFGAATNFPVGNKPYSIISADFNGDGKLDLATASQTSFNASVLLGNGNGSFGAAQSFSVGAAPRCITTADFNGDGKLDLVTSNQTSNDVSLLLGTGTGSFSAATNFGVGTYPTSVINEDFNGDGKKDLAVANYTTNDVSILLGTGTGSFSPAVNYGVGIGGTNPNSIISADFNGDGKLDLAVANYASGEITVSLGTGTGTFDPATYFLAGYLNLYEVCTADFNGDGKADLAVGNAASSNKISLLLNCASTQTCVATVTDSLYKDIQPLTWDILPHYSAQVNNAKWTWGDGTFSIGLYPSHTYTAAGWYSICVTAYTSCGDSAIACRNDSLYKMTNSNSMVNINIVATITGVNQLTENKDQVTIYPNPSTNYITIQSLSEIGMISLFNSLGEVVLQIQSKNTREQIDISKFSVGMYTLQVKNKYMKIIKE